MFSKRHTRRRTGGATTYTATQWQWQAFREHKLFFPSRRRPARKFKGEIIVYGKSKRRPSILPLPEWRLRGGFWCGVVNMYVRTDVPVAGVELEEARLDPSARQGPRAVHRIRFPRGEVALKKNNNTTTS